jgi:hypothetical protein
MISVSDFCFFKLLSNMLGEHCPSPLSRRGGLYQDSLGNPPDKPKAPEVEFSMKEVLREEVKITDSQITAALKRVEVAPPGVAL